MDELLRDSYLSIGKAFYLGLKPIRLRTYRVASMLKKSDIRNYVIIVDGIF